jgi:hypothetical protein
MDFQKRGRFGYVSFAAANFPVKDLGVSFRFSTLAREISDHAPDPTFHLTVDIIWVYFSFNLYLWPFYKRNTKDV